MIEIPEIQYITRDHAEYSHSEQARMMFAQGIKWVQIRMKNRSKAEVYREAKLAMTHAENYKGTLIVNDAVDIAIEVKAHGVHLGLKDMPVNEAREMLGNDFIIGGTANTFEDLQLQIARGADYVGVGPFRFTTTKQNLSPILGVDGYKKLLAEIAAKNIKIPIVAVGGISTEDIPTLREAGIKNVAISAALFTEYV